MQMVNFNKRPEMTPLRLGGQSLLPVHSQFSQLEIIILSAYLQAKRKNTHMGRTSVFLSQNLGAL
jgi:hypothetical protein